VEEPALSQTEEETTGSLHAGPVEAPASLESSVPTDRKNKWRRAYRLLGMIMA
jgi:hypothetical protein